eukprot:Seg733.10 transcript_id=Seg733.10/GoldUCD/mRNA.D3Y31 product="Cationic amino acid transporter 2" protein_id=Seg733.10/GoldUCD/D3Y31
MRLTRMLKDHLTSLCATITRKKVLTSDDFKGSRLSKCLGTFDLIAIGVSATLGSGIYVLTGEVAKTLTGPAIVLSFLIAAITSLLSGLCYTEFATRVPKAGSAYTYTFITVGEIIAFITGWNLILEYAIGSAVVARAFSAYLDSFVGGAISNGTQNALGHVHLYGFGTSIDFISFGIVILFSILLSSGVKNSAILNNILTVLNLIVAAGVFVIGLFYVKRENWSDFAPYGVEGVLTGASTCFFAFIGFDIIATTAEEAKNPGKSLPLSIMGTIAICFVVYFCVSTVVTLMVPYKQLTKETAVSDAFKFVNAKWASYVVSVGAAISMLGCTLVSLFGLPRLIYAMAEDCLIPSCLARVNKKTDTPVIATMVSGIVTGLLAMFMDLGELVEMLSIGTLLAYTMVVICVLRLRYQINEPEVIISEPPREQKDIINDTDDDTEPSFQQKSTNEHDKIVNKTKIDKKQNNVILLCLTLIMLDLFTIAAILVFGRHINSALFYSIVSICTIAVIGLGIFLAKQPQNQEELVFRTPFVPVLPIFALFVNLYLMLELRRLTWIRLVVWMAVGSIVYIGYGVRKSVASKYKRRGSEEYQPLIDVRKKETEASTVSMDSQKIQGRR